MSWCSLEDKEALSTSPQLRKQLNREVGVPDIPPAALLTKPHKLFTSAPAWTTWLFLTQTPLISSLGYTPTCSPWPSFLRRVAFSGISRYLRALALHPRAEAFTQINSHLEGPVGVSNLSTWSRDSDFSAASLRSTQWTWCRKPRVQSMTLLHSQLNPSEAQKAGIWFNTAKCTHGKESKCHLHSCSFTSPSSPSPTPPYPTLQLFLSIFNKPVICWRTQK